MKPERPIKTFAIATNLRYTLAVLITLLPGLFAFGQVKFTTVVSTQEMVTGDYLQVEFVVENARQIDALNPPDFPGFRVAQGPIQSSGMSVINGNTSQYKGLSFVLQPTRTGKFTIAGASAVVDGQHMRSNTVTITVHAGGSGTTPGSQGGGGNMPGNPMLQMQPFGPDPFGPPAQDEVDRDYVLKPGENVKEKIRKNLFVKVQVDRNSCYVGEPIVATYKLYSRLSSESRVTKRPYLNGFSVYDMVDPGSDPVSVEKLNGKAYTVHIIRKTQLIPLQPGSIDLDPVEVENTVHFVKGGARAEPRRTGNPIRDLLDQLTDERDAGPEISENVTLDTKPLTITVRPLPEENKPANYNGAVGSFSVEASLADKNVAAQDEATLHVVVKGKGNLPVINAPAVDWPAGIEAFDPTAKEDVNKTVVPMSGTKSFDYVFTAKTPGRYTIPAVNFSWFDPSSQTYKTAGSEPLDLQVAPMAKRPRSSAHPGLTEAVPSAGERLQHFILDHLVWLLAFLLLFGVIVFFYLRRQNPPLKKDGGSAGDEAAKDVQAATGGTKAATGQGRDQSAGRSNAPIAKQWKELSTARHEGPGQTDRSGASSAAYLPVSAPVDPLLEARSFFDNGDYKAFYREVNRAVWKSIGKKLELPSSELNKQNCVRQLQLRGWDAPSILSLENILNECEMSLYTPNYDTYNMQQLLRQAENVLVRLS
jgi:BatD DUF11 like domain